MPARVFLSYRTADGADKATALARDLGARFGDDAVFLDKDDLTAGGSWRDEIAREVAERPVVLALITPLYLGATAAGGARRIESPDDPVRAEWQAAMDAGAHVVPLLADGVDALPPADALPETFRSLHARTWRRLRAYDWKTDVARLAEDLTALGVVPRGTPDPIAGAARARTRWLVGGAAAAALAILAIAVLRPGGPRPDAPAPTRPAETVASAPIAPAAPASAPYDLAGRWRTELAAPSPAAPGRGPLAFVATWTHDGERVRFASEPVDVATDPLWTNHRDHWKQKTGQPLARVVWRGSGVVVAAGTEAGFAPAPDAPRRLAMELYVYAEGSADSDAWLQKGGLFAPLEPRAARMQGRAWLSSEGADRQASVWREAR